MFSWLLCDFFYLFCCSVWKAVSICFYVEWVGSCLLMRLNLWTPTDGDDRWLMHPAGYSQTCACAQLMWWRRKMARRSLWELEAQTCGNVMQCNYACFDHVWIMFDHGHVHFWGSKVLYYWTWPGAFLVWQVPLQQRPLAWKKLCTSQRHQPGSAVSKTSKRDGLVSYSFVVHLQISGGQRLHLRAPQITTPTSQRSYSFYSGTWLWLAGTLLTLLQRLPSKLLASKNRIPSPLMLFEHVWSFCSKSAKSSNLQISCSLQGASFWEEVQRRRREERQRPELARDGQSN